MHIKNTLKYTIEIEGINFKPIDKNTIEKLIKKNT